MHFSDRTATLQAPEVLEGRFDYLSLLFSSVAILFAQLSQPSACYELYFCSTDMRVLPLFLATLGKKANSILRRFLLQDPSICVCDIVS